MDRLCLARDVYDEIARTVGSMKAEQGGALGWREDERVVRYFWFDDTAGAGATYSPDDKALNAMFRQDWNPRGIRLAGFVHSHPRALRGHRRATSPMPSASWPRSLTCPIWCCR